MKKIIFSFFVLVSIMVFPQKRNEEGKIISTTASLELNVRCCRCPKWRIVFIDSITREPLPFVTVKSDSNAWFTDIDGSIELNTVIYIDGIKSIWPERTAQFVGYKSKKLNIIPDNDTIEMSIDQLIHFDVLFIDPFQVDPKCIDSSIKSVYLIEAMNKGGRPDELRINYGGCTGNMFIDYEDFSDYYLMQPRKISVRPENIKIITGGIPGTYGDVKPFRVNP